MFFRKTKKINELEQRIENADLAIRNILFDKSTSTEWLKKMITVLIKLDRDYAEFLLNEYLAIGTNKEYPKTANDRRRYNVIGPMIRKALTKLDDEKKVK